MRLQKLYTVSIYPCGGLAFFITSATWGTIISDLEFQAKGPRDLPQEWVKAKDSFWELIHIFHSLKSDVLFEHCWLGSNDKFALLEYMVSAGIDQVNACMGTRKMETTPVAGAHSINLNPHQPALQGNTCQEILMVTNHNVSTEL